jgi:hypothetical protein
MTTFTETIDGGSPSSSEVSLSGEMGALLSLVSQQLKDDFGLAWPPSKLLPYVNLCFQEIINLRPEANVVETVVSLVAGARQASLMTTSIEIINAVCNMGTTGTTVGTTITSVKKNSLDHILPGWMTFTADQTVRHVVLDPREPLAFYTFPPQPASPSKIMMLVSQPVEEVTIDTSDFPLDPSYKPAFVDYMIYRALSEETSIPNALNKATMFYNQFLKGLGLKTNTEKQVAAAGE